MFVTIVKMAMIENNNAIRTLNKWKHGKIKDKRQF